MTKIQGEGLLVLWIESGEFLKGYFLGSNKGVTRFHPKGPTLYYKLWHVREARLFSVIFRPVEGFSGKPKSHFCQGNQA